MDLNICLYCEKQLLEEGKSFCSSTCQSNEASKPVYTFTTNNPSLLFISSRSTSTVSPTYEIAYRRRRYSSSYYPSLSSSSSSTSSNCSYYSTMDHHSTSFSSHSKNVYTNFFSS